MPSASRPGPSTPPTPPRISRASFKTPPEEPLERLGGGGGGHQQPGRETSDIWATERGLPRSPRSQPRLERRRIERPSRRW
eukprot:8116606-Pyramimonas_sp.AAC.1